MKNSNDKSSFVEFVILVLAGYEVMFPYLLVAVFAIALSGLIFYLYK